MGSEITAPDLPMIDVMAPEYFWTHIGKVEDAGGDCLRFYCCVQKGDHLETVFTCVIPTPQLAVAARRALVEAANHHNGRILSSPPIPPPAEDRALAGPQVFGCFVRLRGYQRIGWDVPADSSANLLRKLRRRPALARKDQR